MVNIPSEGMRKKTKNWNLVVSDINVANLTLGLKLGHLIPKAITENEKRSFNIYLILLRAILFKTIGCKKILTIVYPPPPFLIFNFLNHLSDSFF